VTPLDRAIAALLNPLRPVRTEDLALADAVGATLADPIVNPAALPSRAVALRTGWAVTAIETVGAAAYAPAFLASMPERVRAGDMLPDGADAVVPPDAVTLAGVAELTLEATPGEGARRVGEDAAAGAILRPAGARVRGSDVALAAAAGVTTCTVRRARVALVGHPAAEAACTIVTSDARQLGAVVSAHSATQVSAAGLRELEADLVVLVGFDEAGALALAQGGCVIAAGLGLRPGEETSIGLLDGGMPVLLVSARAEAAFAASRCVLQPCLVHLIGATAELPAYRAPLTRKIASAVGVAELALLRTTSAGLEPLAVADLMLAALCAADAWLLVPADREGYAAGEVVEAFAV
jgi:molybdopterin biosynthesis enzyme